MNPIYACLLVQGSKEIGYRPPSRCASKYRIKTSTTLNRQESLVRISGGSPLKMAQRIGHIDLTATQRDQKLARRQPPSIVQRNGIGNALLTSRD